MTRTNEVTAARVGGWALILAAILFIAVFSYLGATFNYPDVLDRPAAEVLPRLIALGTAGRAVWSLYALIPLLLVPAGIGGVVAGVIGCLAIFRNMTPAVSPLADANDLILPLWLVVLGVALARERAADERDYR